MDWRELEDVELPDVIDLLDISFPSREREKIESDVGEIRSDSRFYGKMYRLRVDSELVATATYGRLYGGGYNGEALIRYLAVAPAYRKRGYATSIVGRILFELKTTEKLPVYLSSAVSDPGLIPMWEGFGFRRVGIFEDEGEKHYSWVRVLNAT